MIHYLWMFIVGILAGAVARFVVPGQEHMGILMTGVLGIVGSFVGGFVGSLISKPADGSMFHASGFFMSILGAIVVLVAWHFVR
jgi:uncharacterized membrane protein YeaQ/YmgE (transglycosylase-associated protein family)